MRIILPPNYFAISLRFIAVPSGRPVVRRLTAAHILIFLCFLVAIPAWSAPKIVCEAPLHEFGKRSNSGTIEHIFTIENRGSEQLRFGELKSCCGLTTDFPTHVLPPGSNRVCKVTFSLKNRRGVQNKAIYIASNDRRNPYLALTLKGSLYDALSANPRLLRYTAKDASTPKKVRIISGDQKPFSITSAKSSIPGQQLQSKQVSGTEWELTVEVPSSAKGGKLRGTISVTTDHPEQPILKLPMIGSLPPALKIVPSEIAFKAGSGTVTRHIAIRGEEPFKILSTDLENAAGTIEQKPLGKTGWQCTLTIDVASIQPNAKLTLNTDHPTIPHIRVPLRLLP